MSISLPPLPVTISAKTDDLTLRIGTHIVELQLIGRDDFRGKDDDETLLGIAHPRILGAIMGIKDLVVFDDLVLSLFLEFPERSGSIAVSDLTFDIAFSSTQAKRSSGEITKLTWRSRPIPASRRGILY